MQVSAGRHDNKLDCVVRCNLVKLTDAFDPNPKTIEDGEHRARRREDGLLPIGAMMDYRLLAR